MRRVDASHIALLFAMLVVHFNVAMGIARAQQTVNYASVSGLVKDPTGAVIANAQIVARQTETNLTATTTTDEEGRFRFPYLKSGAYEITVRATGFADAIRSVTLTLGAAFEFTVSLSVASVQTDVSVSEQPEIIELSRTQISGTV